MKFVKNIFMKQKLIYLTVMLLLMQNILLAQTPNRTPEKIKQDSIEFEEFKKENPELFLNKRLPIKLLDGNFYVLGYNLSQSGLRIINNHIIDSVYHNAHLGSTEQGTIPYNNINVSDENISVDLFFSNVFTESRSADSALINPINEEEFKKGFIDGKKYEENAPSSFIIAKGLYNNFPTVGISKFKRSDSIEIRISINGKLLFDWKKLSLFSTKAYKQAQRWYVKKIDSHFWSIQYSYGFHICDEKLNINDQLLIEIKDDRNNWMLDRFNITRVSATPAISFLAPANKNETVNIAQKKLHT